MTVFQEERDCPTQSCKMCSRQSTLSRRIKGRVAAIVENKFSVVEIGDAAVPIGDFTRDQLTYEGDVRVTLYKLRQARNHTCDKGPRQPFVKKDRWRYFLRQAAYCSMFEFATSPAAITHLSGNTRHTAKRTMNRQNLYELYCRWCTDSGKNKVSRSFWYVNAFDESVTDDNIEECVCCDVTNTGGLALLCCGTFWKA